MDKCIVERTKFQSFEAGFARPECYDIVKNIATDAVRQGLRARLDGPPAGGGGGYGPTAPAPVTMPSSALEAALELAELSDRLGLGLALVPLVRNKDTGKLKPARRHVHQLGPQDRPDYCLADVQARSRDYRRAAGIGDVSGQLLDLDPDTAEAGLLAAELAGDRPTFAYESRRGRHRIYWRRDLVPADHRGNMVHNPARPAEALAPGLDVVLGAVTLWGPGKTWLTAPDTIAEPPQALRERIAACWAARQARIAQAQERREEAERRRLEREAAGLEKERGRLEAYAQATLGGILRDVAGLAKGQRAQGVFGLAARAGSLVAAPWSGVTEAAGEAGLLDAALACGLTEREAAGHVRRGLRAGMADPMPEPTDRALPGRGGAQTGAERVELERQAEAAAASWRQARGKVHPAKLRSAQALAEALARRMLAEGQATVAVGLRRLAIDADLGLAAARSARDVLVTFCGWRLILGGIGDDGAPRPTRWAFPQDRTAPTLNERQDYQEAQDGYERHPALSGAILRKRRQDGLGGAWRRPVGLLERGLRRQLQGLACALDDHLEDHLEDVLRACGPSSRPIVAALLQVENTATVAELAEAAGVSVDTAARVLRRLAERGLVTSSTRPTAGRPARACALTTEARAAALGEAVADPSPLLAATLQAGAERLRRAEAQLAAERSLLEDARRVAEVAGVPVAVAAQAMREEVQRRARAERDRSQAGLESPLIADARRREGRVSIALAQARVAVAQLRACWAMGAPLPQAVPA